MKKGKTLKWLSLEKNFFFDEHLHRKTFHLWNRFHSKLDFQTHYKANCVELPNTPTQNSHTRQFSCGKTRDRHTYYHDLNL